MPLVQCASRLHSIMLPSRLRRGKPQPLNHPLAGKSKSDERSTAGFQRGSECDDLNPSRSLSSAARPRTSTSAQGGADATLYLRITGSEGARRHPSLH